MYHSEITRILRKIPFFSSLFLILFQLTWFCCCEWGITSLYTLVVFLASLDVTTLTRLSPRFVINWVQIEFMHRHTIDCTNCIHINVFIVFCILYCSRSTSWLEIPVYRCCIWSSEEKLFEHQHGTYRRHLKKNSNFLQSLCNSACRDW